MRLEKSGAAPWQKGATRIKILEAPDTVLSSPNTDKLQEQLLAEIANWRQRRVTFPKFGRAAR